MSERSLAAWARALASLAAAALEARADCAPAWPWRRRSSWPRWSCRWPVAVQHPVGDAFQLVCVGLEPGSRPRRWAALASGPLAGSASPAVLKRSVEGLVDDVLHLRLHLGHRRRRVGLHRGERGRPRAPGPGRRRGSCEDMGGLLNWNSRTWWARDRVRQANAIHRPAAGAHDPDEHGGVGDELGQRPAFLLGAPGAEQLEERHPADPGGEEAGPELVGRVQVVVVVGLEDDVGLDRLERGSSRPARRCRPSAAARGWPAPRSGPWR